MKIKNSKRENVTIGDLCCNPLTQKEYCDGGCPMFNIEKQICNTSFKTSEFINAKNVFAFLKLPKLFMCEKCKVFFFSYSQLEKPTHPKCFGHNTRLATNEEIFNINQKNKMQIPYNGVVQK